MENPSILKQICANQIQNCPQTVVMGRSNELLLLLSQLQAIYVLPWDSFLLKYNIVLESTDAVDIRYVEATDDVLIYRREPKTMTNLFYLLRNWRPSIGTGKTTGVIEYPKISIDIKDTSYKQSPKETHIVKLHSIPKIDNPEFFVQGNRITICTSKSIMIYEVGERVVFKTWVSIPPNEIPPLFTTYGHYIAIIIGVSLMILNFNEIGSDNCFMIGDRCLVTDGKRISIDLGITQTKSNMIFVSNYPLENPPAISISLQLSLPFVPLKMTFLNDYLLFIISSNGDVALIGVDGKVFDSACLSCLKGMDSIVSNSSSIFVSGKDSLVILPNPCESKIPFSFCCDYACIHRLKGIQSVVCSSEYLFVLNEVWRKRIINVYSIANPADLFSASKDQSERMYLIKMTSPAEQRYLDMLVSELTCALKRKDDFTSKVIAEVISVHPNRFYFNGWSDFASTFSLDMRPAVIANNIVEPNILLDQLKIRKLNVDTSLGLRDITKVPESTLKQLDRNILKNIFRSSLYQMSEEEEVLCSCFEDQRFQDLLDTASRLTINEFHFNKWQKQPCLCHWGNESSVMSLIEGISMEYDLSKLETHQFSNIISAITKAKAADYTRAIQLLGPEVSKELFISSFAKTETDWYQIALQFCGTPLGTFARHKLLSSAHGPPSFSLDDKTDEELMELLRTEDSVLNLTCKEIFL